MLDRVFKYIIGLLIAYLEQPSSNVFTSSTHTFEQLRNTLIAGDVILVEGKQRFSAAVKYLTQSNWSHAVLYIGEGKVIEADLKFGVVKADVLKFENFHTRICRPVGLSDSDLNIIIDFIQEQQGLSYDIQNIFDLARYLIPVHLVPSRFKRQLLEFGSRDPTKVICSSIIAQAFQKVFYPILPLQQDIGGEIKYSFRHHSFFTPSDFDRSPYFEVIKPTLVSGFNYKNVAWIDR